MEGRIPPNANIKRWDGRAKACAAWDSLRRDPELWFDHGNCLVHLYGKGQSRRGPAFKVPLAALVEAKCHPLLNRYFLRIEPESATFGASQALCDGTEMGGTVNLYVSPPSKADKKQILEFYLAMRNLFAWMCRRSIVGEQLGGAAIALVDSMREFRSPDVDNVADVMSYIADLGYLDMANQPIHALAMVHFAEYYQLRDLYINAFAHCAGMGDCLYGLPEYQAVSSITRKLLRRAQTSVEAKLSRASKSLNSFHEDDLSESNIGLTAGGKAHLERFRTFLLAFYAHRLGYYPPSPMDTRSCMWDPDIYQVMRTDFEALYEFLADRTITTTDSASYRAQGGICVLQSVHSFDLRHKFKPLPHPLSRLPEETASTASKRVSWFGRTESKLRPDRRLVAHAALVKATNNDAAHVARNPLVAAYRTFEEDSLYSQLKFDKIEKLSQVDARKIRWVLIYGVYQTLRSCTDAPPEVTDTNSAGYSVAIPTNELPPWKEKPGPSFLRMRSRMSIMSPVPSVPSSGRSTPGLSREIRPDIDYFPLTRRQHDTDSPPFQIPPRSGSLRKVLSQTGSLRKSLGSLKGETRPFPVTMTGPTSSNRCSPCQEIVIHGHFHGTNAAHDDSRASDVESLRPGALANRTPSTSSHSSTGSSTNSVSDVSPRSEESWGSGQTSIPTTPLEEGPDKLSAAVRRASVVSTASSVYSTPDEPACPPPPPLPRRNSKRKSLGLSFDELDARAPAPLRITKTPPVDDRERWRAIENEVDERCEAVPAGRLLWRHSLDDGDIA